MLSEITRKIDRAVERELWTRSGGRCQFRSCNRILYKSPITHQSVNIAQKAHIYSFSEEGPRGHGPLAKRKTELNAAENLLLICPICHLTIDDKKLQKKYTAKILQEWKRDHEARIALVTGINPKCRSHVVLYGSRIGEEHTPLQAEEAFEAMFPGWFPANEMPIELSMLGAHQDKTPEFWRTEDANLIDAFNQRIEPMIRASRATHFSLFGLADIPLLVRLGSLFTDKRVVETYQRHRAPQTWKWLKGTSRKFRYILKAPRDTRGLPVLLLSLSASIDPAHVQAVLSGKLAVWELTVADPHNDFLRSRGQLLLFQQAARRAIARIARAHRGQSLHILPAIPVACAVEFGRVRMPKFDAPWILYDYNHNLKGFTNALTIGEHHEPAKQ